MRADNLAAFAKIEGMDVVVPQPAPDGKMLDAEKGLTPNGTVSTLDEAEVVAEYFRRQRVDGVILCPLDFGDGDLRSRSPKCLGCRCCCTRQRNRQVETMPG